MTGLLLPGDLMGAKDLEVRKRRKKGENVARRGMIGWHLEDTRLSDQ